MAGQLRCYWLCMFQGKLGQSRAISIVSLEGEWANSMPLAVCHLAGAGAIPCYQHGLFREGLGQLKATNSLTLEQLWAISNMRSEEHTSELQSRQYLVCRLLLGIKNRSLLVTLCLETL